MALKLVKDSGLLSSYEELVSELAEMEQLPEDPYEFAADFFLNCEKKKQAQIRKIQASYSVEPVVEEEAEESSVSKPPPRRLTKVALKSRSNAPPPLPKVTASTFQITQLKPRPVITSIKREEIKYGYVDIVTKQEVRVVTDTKDQPLPQEDQIIGPEANSPELEAEPIEDPETRFQSHEVRPEDQGEEGIAEAIDDEPLPPQ